MTKFHIFIASGLGSGFARFAPGTWGTLVGSVLVFLMWQGGILFNDWILTAVTVGTTLLGYWSVTQLPESWIHDDQRIVIDEVVGLFATMMFIPLSLKSIILGFILFRVFDIWKPLGIRKFDNLKSDSSVIVDDLLAGVYANIALRGLLLILIRYDIY